MTELMNLEMVLPAPLNPPFPERHAMDALGRVHFIGIGGAGMSAIAALMLQAGVTVSGSDRAESSAVESLRAAGVGTVIAFIRASDKNRPISKGGI